MKRDGIDDDMINRLSGQRFLLLLFSIRERIFICIDDHVFV